MRTSRNPLLPCQPLIRIPAQRKPCASTLATRMKLSFVSLSSVLTNSTPTPTFPPEPLDAFHEPAKLRSCTENPATFPAHRPMPSFASIVARPEPYDPTVTGLVDVPESEASNTSPLGID